MRYAFASLLPSHHFLKEDAYARPSISTAPCIVHLFYKLSYKSFKSLNPGSAFCRALTAQRGGMICWHGKAIIRRSGSRSAFSKPMLLQKVPDCSRFCSSRVCYACPTASIFSVIFCISADGATSVAILLQAKRLLRASSLATSHTHT